MKRKYHYEYAAYTDNLCWGRMMIVQGRSEVEVRMKADLSGKGAYRIERIKVFDE